MQVNAVFRLTFFSVMEKNVQTNYRRIREFDCKEKSLFIDVL
jgi:hypothetical protein